MTGEMARSRRSPAARLLVWGFLLAALLGAAPGLTAQDYNLSNMLFLPPIYYVGDEVELRVTIRSPQIQEVAVPQELPRATWGEILSMRLLDQGNARELRIRFVAYQTGTLTLPALNLGPLVLEELSISVSSSLESEGAELEGPRDQVLLPGTQAFLVMAAGAVLLIPLIWLTIFRWGRLGLKRIIAVYREGRPFRRAIRHIRGLRSSADSMHGREFYIRLLDEIRAYLGSRFAISAFSLTTRELEQVFDSLVHNTDDRKALTRMFLHGDMVKFANLPSTITGRMSHLDQAEQIIMRMETLERRRRREDQQQHREGEGI
ncbi:hypothetical protein [Spirochaeta lutea]|uniref:DUF4381 domain-containing protein n=1 Tax=Spirochaeta lutea TaxID=1480694 RepID=A0A098R0H1_9SPIO|nr:hypothetical protein [Spirochaeta lutea]KGE73434.1 hypothetical protein DC28_04010 [Spirochaeta lutea]